MSPEDRIARAQAEDAARALAAAAPVVEELQHAPIIETPPLPAVVLEEPQASYVDPGAPVVELIPEEKMNEQKLDASRESAHPQDVMASQTGEIIGKIDGIKLDVTEPESAEVVANKVEQLVGAGTGDPADPEHPEIPLFVVGHSVPCGNFVDVWTSVRDALYLPSLYETETDLPIPTDLVARLTEMGVNPDFLSAYQWREALNEIEVRIRKNGWAGSIVLLYAPEDIRVISFPNLFVQLALATGPRFRTLTDIPAAPSEGCDTKIEEEGALAVEKSASAPAPFFPEEDPPATPPAPPAPAVEEKVEEAPPAAVKVAPGVKVVKRVENSSPSRYSKHSQGPGKTSK